MTEDTTIAEYMHEILIGKKSSRQITDIIQNSDSKKLRILWSIFFDTGIHDLKLLEERIYAYGSELKDKDLLGREVFLALISILNQMK